MAQSNSFFGHRRGSTKSLTFQRRSGVQITQDRKEHVRDAQSVGQAQHRCLLHTTVDACSWLAPIFNFAWQGAKGREAYQSAFRKANYDIVRAAALGGQAGFTYSPYRVRTAPVGYWQIANGSLPYHGNFFKNGINGVDYTETDFLNYTAEGESWYQVLNRAGLKVGDSFLLFILFRNPQTGTISHDIARVHLADVPDVTIGLQTAGSLVTIEWVRNFHNWTMIDNSIRILTLRCQHTEFDPSAQVMFTAAFQYEQRRGRTMVSRGFLWHWGYNIDGLTFDEAIVTYPMAEGFAPVMHPVPEELYVDMGLPSGILWATRNLDVTQKNGFAASPFQYECSFFSWGNIDGHNPINQSEFDYDFGTSNSGPYAQTTGAALTTNIDEKHDAATQILGGSWRMPATSEFIELINNSSLQRVYRNGVLVLQVTSNINRNVIYFPLSGNASSASWYDKGNAGYYWSRNLSATNRNSGLGCGISTGNVYPSSQYARYFGFAIRPVREPSKRKKSDPDEK